MKLDPVTLPNGLVLRNPLMLAPMTTKMSFYNGHVTLDEIQYYANRSHDIGAVITGAANVQAIGRGWEGELAIFDDCFLPELSQLAKAIQAGGAKAILQIFHAGRMTNRNILGGQQPVSASAIAAERPNAEVPRALTSDEVSQLIKDFQAATKRAIQAGFDGIELHGANTYMLQQFFSPHSNRREDEWGGSLEKRYHFIDTLLDVVLETVKAEANRPFIVGYRFSPEEYETPGISMADTLYLVEQLARKPIDYLHVSLYNYQMIAHDKTYQAQSILAYIHQRISGRVPLVGVGGIQEADDVKGALKNCELVAVGRSLIHDPNWGHKILNDKATMALESLDFDAINFGQYDLFDYVQSLRLDHPGFYL